MKKAIILFSGGLDSATTLYWAIQKRYDPHCLLFDYGQRHKKELQSAVKICKIQKVPYQVVKFFLPWGGSALINKDLDLPVQRNWVEMSRDIPSTYVPARNTIFLSFALSYAEAIGAKVILMGANAIDFSGYPDCRPNFIKAFQKVAKLGTQSGVENKTIKIITPLIYLTKSQIIKVGIKLGVPYQMTWSCYQGARSPCGQCDSCLLRKKGFAQAGAADL